MRLLASVRKDNDFWLERASRYEAGRNGEWHRNIAEALVKDAGLMPGERVLDLGCGTGLATRAARSFVGPSGLVVGVDRSPAMLQWAAANSDADIVFLPADVESLAGVEALSVGSVAAPYDAILAAAVVPYLVDPPGSLRQWRTLLCPGTGRLLFHGFKNANVMGELLVRSAAEVGVALDFERWTGGRHQCLELLAGAGYSDGKITQVIDISNVHTRDEALLALNGMLENPLVHELKKVLLADAQRDKAFREAYQRLLDAESSKSSDGKLVTAGECYVAMGSA